MINRVMVRMEGRIITYSGVDAKQHMALLVIWICWYEAGRLYGTTEVIRQCTEHEAPLNLF